MASVRVLGVILLGLPAPPRWEIVVDEGPATPAETILVPGTIVKTEDALKAYLLGVLDLQPNELLWPKDLRVPGALYVPLQERARIRKERRPPPKPPKPAR